MAQQQPRIVAELGRPETPDETAARKAESSRIYRSSQSFRNLIAALIVTLAIVVIIIFVVPRGTPSAKDPIDVPGIAADVASSVGRAAVAPDLGEGWVVNLAQLDDTGGLRAWNVVFAQDEQHGVGFLRVAQGFDADPAWPTRVLGGAAVGQTMTVDGIVWDRFEITDPSRAGNITGAISTVAGPDTILIYGTADDASFESAAASVAEEVRQLREETGE